MTNRERIEAYYEDLNSGEAAQITRHFTPDAVHYYTRLGPHEGREAIAGNAVWAVETLGARWHLESAIVEGDAAAIEWSMTWRDADSGERRINRGSEMFGFSDEGLIEEVRAYHHGDAKNPSGDLLGFDSIGRGYTQIHPE